MSAPVVRINYRYADALSIVNSLEQFAEIPFDAFAQAAVANWAIELIQSEPPEYSFLDMVALSDAAKAAGSRDVVRISDLPGEIVTADR